MSILIMMFNFTVLSQHLENQITNVEEKNTNYLLEVDNHVVVPVGKKFAFLLLLMMFYMLGMYPLLLLNKMLFLDLSETHGSKLKRQEFTEANVPNYAENSMHICQ